MENLDKEFMATVKKIVRCYQNNKGVTFSSVTIENPFGQCEIKSFIVAYGKTNSVYDSSNIYAHMWDLGEQIRVDLTTDFLETPSRDFDKDDWKGIWNFINEHYERGAGKDDTVSAG